MNIWYSCPELHSPEIFVDWINCLQLFFRTCKAICDGASHPHVKGDEVCHTQQTSTPQPFHGESEHHEEWQKICVRDSVQHQTCIVYINTIVLNY